MKNSKKVSLMVILMLVLTLPMSALAHGGRTDGAGGHRDNKNASGLGYYHYHHGMGPHLHPGGVCSLASPAPAKSYSKTTSPTPKKPTYNVEDRLFYVNNNIEYLNTIIKDNKSLVELKSLSEAFNISPEYRKDSNSVLIEKVDGNKVVFFINTNKIIDRNGETQKLDASTIVHEGRTYIPLRAFTDNLAFNLNYENGIYYIN